MIAARKELNSQIAKSGIPDSPTDLMKAFEILEKYLPFIDKALDFIGTFSGKKGKETIKRIKDALRCLVTE